MFSMPQIFIGLDVITSTMCIILMYSWNDRLYLKLCCLFVKKRDEIREKAVKNLVLVNMDSNGLSSTNQVSDDPTSRSPTEREEQSQQL